MTLLTSILIQLTSSLAIAEEKTAKKKANESDGRTTSLNFEDNIVEGMNKQPLDSLNELSDGKNNLDDNHLYRKRRKFELENSEEIRILRYL